ncbi:LytR family transcriptional regulator [Moorena producens PAL-8-15-08-1]|uniref:LytR family transcriptional regulator n=1 Tax=Moorena producens PAL-8-15-08-1 TaxID=1458985 RepID=A0A1D8TN55_9CYAN|nr:MULTISPECIES: LCP family protein [Moorena]AOW98835.1 LytR family transcriptional regulator [Moorena producens PAL-8-15-08-1]
MPVQRTYRKRRVVRRPTRPVRRKKVKVKRGNWLWLWLGFTAVAMSSAAAGAILAVSLASTPLLQSELTQDEKSVFNQEETISSNTMHLPELTRPVNILFLGIKVLTSDLDKPPEVDLGYHALVNSLEGLSDTMLLLRFDPDGEKVKVLSMPRDTKTRIEKHGKIKLNAANYFGGPALTAKAVSDLLDDVPIDRYIRVNVQGVEKLVDALGGVTVYIPKDMKYTDHSQHLYINLKKGRQHLDGNKAMQFLRFRYDKYGDIGRVQRQQILMRALVEQALKPSTIARIPQILSVIQSHIDTNLSVEELVALAGFATKTKRANVQMLMLPGRFSNDGKKQASYWLPNHRRIQEMVAQHFGQGYTYYSNANSTSLRIAIQYTTDSSEVAKAMLRNLNRGGYNNVRIDQKLSREPLRTTRIIAQQGDDESAGTIRNYLGFGEVRVESTGAFSSDITIQLGQDWLQKLDYPQ